MEFLFDEQRSRMSTTCAQFYSAQQLTRPERYQEAKVTSSSKGLAEITKAGRLTIQFVHESVRDFLVKERGIQDINNLMINEDADRHVQPHLALAERQNGR